MIIITDIRTQRTACTRLAEGNHHAAFLGNTLSVSYIARYTQSCPVFSVTSFGIMLPGFSCQRFSKHAVFCLSPIVTAAEADVLWLPDYDSHIGVVSDTAVKPHNVSVFQGATTWHTKWLLVWSSCSRQLEPSSQRSRPVEVCVSCVTCEHGPLRLLDTSKCPLLLDHSSWNTWLCPPPLPIPWCQMLLTASPPAEKAKNTKPIIVSLVFSQPSFFTNGSHFPFKKFSFLSSSPAK